MQLDEAFRPQPTAKSSGKSRAGRSPLELFGDYMAEQKTEDPRLTRMFAELLEDVTEAGAGA